VGVVQEAQVLVGEQMVLTQVFQQLHLLVEVVEDQLEKMVVLEVVLVHPAILQDQVIHPQFLLLKEIMEQQDRPVHHLMVEVVAEVLVLQVVIPLDQQLVVVVMEVFQILILQQVLQMVQFLELDIMLEVGLVKVNLAPLVLVELVVGLVQVDHLTQP
jgi:hypothetical protein